MTHDATLFQVTIRREIVLSAGDEYEDLLQPGRFVVVDSVDGERVKVRAFMEHGGGRYELSSRSMKASRLVDKVCYRRRVKS